MGQYGAEIYPKNDFQYGGRPPSWIFENCSFGHLSRIGMWFCISDPNFALIDQYGAEIWPKMIFNMASVRHLEFEKFRFLLNVRHGNWNVHLPTELDQNRIIRGWDMEIMLFSKRRPSAILNLRKLQFWSRDLYRHVILHRRFKFRVDRPIWRRDIAKKRFSVWRPSAILDLLYDVIILHPKTAFYSNFVLNFHGVGFRNFWNISYFMFQHFGLKLPISGLIWTIFGEK